jgi:ADP-ribosylglycohydrolase
VTYREPGQGAPKGDIREEIAGRFGDDLDRAIDEVRPHYFFDVSCQGTVPEAILALLESTDYEDAVRLAVSLGGDSDTLAAITGGIAHAYYNRIPDDTVSLVRKKLPEEFLETIDRFESAFGVGRRHS